MRQRTGLAAALLGQPDLLVLDEPTDGIDPLGRRQIRDVILQAGRRGATIFLNSHLLAETERVCDHVAVLHKGRVVKAGPLATLRRTDAFRVTFARRLRDANDDDRGARARACAAAAGFVPLRTDDDGGGNGDGGGDGDGDGDGDGNGNGNGNGGSHDDEVFVTSFLGTDAAALSTMLQAGLARGLVVVEVAPALVDLETILEQSMTPGAAPPPATATATATVRDGGTA
jgi:ABC-2 type transport system ATP-binding protein